MRKILALLCSSFCIQAFSTELVTNGTFDTSLSGWTAEDTADWNNGSSFTSPDGGHAYFSNGNSPGNPANDGIGNISQLINITSPGNYNLTFNFGFYTENNLAIFSSHTNTLSILYGGSQIGSIQLVQNGSSYSATHITNLGSSIDIVNGTNRSTVNITGMTPNWGNQASYSITSTAGIKTLEFLYDLKDTLFMIDSISLSLSQGLTAPDTQLSLTRLASGLRGAYNSASLISNFPNSSTYDCNLFDVKGMCISAGGRYSTVDNPSSNSSAAVVTLGYKVSPNIRIGGFLDQSVNNNTPSGINLSNKHPMMGAFAYWNQSADGLGYQVKIANAYQDKDLSTTRDVIGTSEAGRGTTSLNSRSYVGELSYAFMYKENTLVRPYFALRHTTIEQDAYTETDVTTPLTYSALNDKTTSALMGVKFKHALTPKANLIGSLGVEQDLHNKTDRLTASGVSGLTSENLSGNIHRTRPVASIGATYDIAKTQRLSGEVLVQQLPFQSTTGATAYFNYMIGF
jgi:hypothetical protein